MTDVYGTALTTIRAGAPGLSDATCEVIARTIARKLKASARLAVRRALERGDLVAKPCAVCGNAEAQAHHENYDLPLEVVWLCVPHHAERHRQLRAQSEAR